MTLKSSLGTLVISAATLFQLSLFFAHYFKSLKLLVLLEHSLYTYTSLCYMPPYKPCYECF